MPIHQDKTLRDVLDSVNKVTRRIPQILGAEAVAYSKDRFAARAWDGQPWPARKATAWGKSDDGKKSRGLLMQTGALRRSIRVIKTAPQYVVIGTDRVYARIHNEGGTVSATQNVRSFRRKSGAQVRAHTRTVVIVIPKRQYMGVSDGLRKRLAQRILSLYETAINS